MRYIQYDAGAVEGFTAIVSDWAECDTRQGRDAPVKGSVGQHTAGVLQGLPLYLHACQGVQTNLQFNIPSSRIELK
jgi:hypothetical protein